MGEAASSLSNTPVWSRKNQKARKGFQEVWYLKMNDPETKKALWLRFTLLISSNGFKKLSEVWAVSFERKEKEIQKLAFKQSYDIGDFSSLSDGSGFKINGCKFTDTHTSGAINSKNRSIQWDLEIIPKTPFSFNFVPQGLGQMGLIKNLVFTVGENLVFNGFSEINGEKTIWHGDIVTTLWTQMENRFPLSLTA